MGHLPTTFDNKWRSTTTTDRIQLVDLYVAACGQLLWRVARRSLKILVSVVQFRPWPPDLADAERPQNRPRFQFRPWPPDLADAERPQNRPRFQFCPWPQIWRTRSGRKRLPPEVRSVQPSLATLPELANAFAVRCTRSAHRSRVRDRTAVGDHAAPLVLQSPIVAVLGDQCGQPGVVGALAGPSNICLRPTASLNADADAVALSIRVTHGLANFILDSLRHLNSAGSGIRQRCGPVDRSLLRHRVVLRSACSQRTRKDANPANGIGVMEAHLRIVAQGIGNS